MKQHHAALQNNNQKLENPIGNNPALIDDSF